MSPDETRVWIGTVSDWQNRRFRLIGEETYLVLIIGGKPIDMWDHVRKRDVGTDKLSRSLIRSLEGCFIPLYEDIIN